MTEEKKILIAEDEKPIAKALEVKLQKSGYQAKAVFNGKEAITELESTDYDAVLLDIMMPVVDGWVVLDHLKNLSKKPFVVITSNLSQPEDISRAKDLGANDFWVKSNTSLAEIVDRLMLHFSKKSS